MRYVYPVRLEDHGETVIAAFRDLPEAITEGRTRAEALAEATDCLDSALLFRVKEKAAVPSPSRLRSGEVPVPASPSVAAKVAFIRAFAASGVTRVGLATRMRLGETEIRRMLDPDHGTKLERLNQGMLVLGRRLIVADEPADAA